MKKLNAILFVLFFAGLLSAQGKIVPSLYYTNGNYAGEEKYALNKDGLYLPVFSGDRSSSSVSGFLTTTFNIYDYVIVGYEDLKIDDKFFDYDQKTYSIGYFKSFFIFSLGFNYSHISGDYTDKVYTFEYSDYTNIYNLNAAYYNRYFYLRASGVFQNVIGLDALKAYQAGLGIDVPLYSNLMVSITGYHSNLSDDRKLYSVVGAVSYNPVKPLNIILEGFTGQRAQFYDPYKLTIFNQIPTQQALISGKLTYNFLKDFYVSASYQYTVFDYFEINYAVAGLKYIISYD